MHNNTTQIAILAALMILPIGAHADSNSTVFQTGNIHNGERKFLYRMEQAGDIIQYGVTMSTNQFNTLVSQKYKMWQGFYSCSGSAPFKYMDPLIGNVGATFVQSQDCSIKVDSKLGNKQCEFNPEQIHELLERMWMEIESGYGIEPISPPEFKYISNHCKDL
ncbi:TPA: hypothetical protein I7730_14070 [Vibrio vulnificus]|uniref:Uncharacterized protein n=1 Tax=Vibrio vulnificus TaxID=672 RepID=A0A8H9N147_VIBVL|nr:hypothetical protein [Vibrio vulnificus]HAS8540912.1 hypothetical protein [Vibrio vulnificus]